MIGDEARAVATLKRPRVLDSEPSDRSRRTHVHTTLSSGSDSVVALFLFDHTAPHIFPPLPAKPRFAYIRRPSPRTLERSIVRGCEPGSARLVGPQRIARPALPPKRSRIGNNDRPTEKDGRLPKFSITCF